MGKAHVMFSIYHRPGPKLVFKNSATPSSNEIASHLVSEHKFKFKKRNKLQRAHPMLPGKQDTHLNQGPPTGGEESQDFSD